MTLSLTDEQDDKLEHLATLQKISKQEAAARAIEAESDRLSNAGEIRDWADHALVRYEGLLHRLAQ